MTRMSWSTTGSSPRQILECARREAEWIQTGKKGFGPSWSQTAINALMIRHARSGRHVVRLKSGDPAVFGRLDEEIEALEAAGIDWEVVPGVTAAAGAAADMGASLTRRGRNSELRFLTGQDVDGFRRTGTGPRWPSRDPLPPFTWASGQPHFSGGRLLMRGADPSTPVTIVENASRPDRQIVATTLVRLPEALDDTCFPGAVVLMFGLLPREAMRNADALDEVRQRAI